MRTLIIGGGKGCMSLLGLARGSFLKEMKLEILAVVDINPLAPGIQYASSIGIKTFYNLDEALQIEDIELIIELTGDDKLLEELYKSIKPGIKVIDHSLTHIFWDLISARDELDNRLAQMIELEKDIEKEKTFLQCIFDANADLMLVLDKDKRILRANSKFCEFAKIKPEEAIGKLCYEVLRNTEIMCEPKEIDEIYKTILLTGKSHTIIRKTSLPNESYWEITRTPIFNPKGDIDSILMTWHKITERIMLKREIESAEQRFKSFINSAQDWISIKDLDGKYIIANPATAKAFNLKPEDFIGRYPEEILNPKLAEIVKKHDEEVIKSKSSRTYNEVYPVDGVDHYFQTVRFPLTDYKGEMIGVCTIARDITLEVNLQEKLAQSDKLAALGKLAAGVAHEINNPLTGILAYSEDLLDKVEEFSSIYEDIKVIIRETLRCRDIVRNLLDFARQDTPKFEVTDCNTIIEQSLFLVERLPQFKDITIEKDLEKNLPKVKADFKQMQQVIINLLINAADSMKYKGKINISTEYTRKDNKCSISVEDSGPGVPENLIDKIFDPFFSTKGTSGLGLAVSWGIVERHHGTIEVDTAENKGAIFKVIIPAYFSEK